MAQQRYLFLCRLRWIFVAIVPLYLAAGGGSGDTTDLRGALNALQRSDADPTSQSPRLPPVASTR